MPTAVTKPKRVIQRVHDVTEMDFLKALAQELQPLEKKPFEFTVTEIMDMLAQQLPAGEQMPTRSAIKGQLDGMVDAKPPLLSSRQGYFDTGKGDGRRKQWAYTILNAEGKTPADIFNKKPAS